MDTHMHLPKVSGILSRPLQSSYQLVKMLMQLKKTIPLKKKNRTNKKYYDLRVMHSGYNSNTWRL